MAGEGGGGVMSEEGCVFSNDVSEKPDFQERGKREKIAVTKARVR